MHDFWPTRTLGTGPRGAGNRRQQEVSGRVVRKRVGDDRLPRRWQILSGHAFEGSRISYEVLTCNEIRWSGRCRCKQSDYLSRAAFTLGCGTEVRAGE